MTSLPSDKTWLHGCRKYWHEEQCHVLVPWVSSDFRTTSERQDGARSGCKPRTDENIAPDFLTPHTRSFYSSGRNPTRENSFHDHSELSLRSPRVTVLIYIDNTTLGLRLQSFRVFELAIALLSECEVDLERTAVYIESSLLLCSFTFFSSITQGLTDSLLNF